LKAPTEYRFAPDTLAFSKAVVERVESKHLLAPEPIIWVLPLLKPNITLEAARAEQTIHNFTIIGKPDEGKRRVSAQQLITTCQRTSEADTALRQSIQNGVNAAIIKQCDEVLLTGVLALLHSCGEWQEVERSHGYLLLLREDSLPSPCSNATASGDK